MNILFLGYWNADEPLTSATIIPHLKILKENNLASTIIFSSIQREHPSSKIINQIENAGAEFMPLYSLNFFINLINKILDFILLPRRIKRIIDSKQIDHVIARGAPAGALAYLATIKSKVSFIVESYEPHADYMKEAGVWHIYDPRYLMQKYWEQKINYAAKHLLTVSFKFKEKLIRSGVSESKIKIARCAVDPEKFVINGSNIRSNHNIPREAIVGIYVGKFGGLYYKNDVFKLIKYLSEYFKGELYFIILSDIDEKDLIFQCSQAGIDREIIKKAYVPHSEVNDYLNSSDFAIAPYKKTKSSSYLSPVKLGEYWATCLPTILTEGVGDETDFIEEELLGISLDFEKLDQDYLYKKFDTLKYLIESADKTYIRKFALEYRSFDTIKNIYKEIIKA